MLLADGAEEGKTESTEGKAGDDEAEEHYGEHLPAVSLRECNRAKHADVDDDRFDWVDDSKRNDPIGDVSVANTFIHSEEVVDHVRR